MPATSPTLSPTLSAMVAGLRGSSSGMPCSTLPTRSAPTSAALVKMPPADAGEQRLGAGAHAEADHRHRDLDQRERLHAGRRPDPVEEREPERDVHQPEADDRQAHHGARAEGDLQALVERLLGRRGGPVAGGGGGLHAEPAGQAAKEPARKERERHELALHLQARRRPRRAAQRPRGRTPRPLGTAAASRRWRRPARSRRSPGCVPTRDRPRSSCRRTAWPGPGPGTRRRTRSPSRQSALVCVPSPEADSSATVSSASVSSATLSSATVSSATGSSGGFAASARTAPDVNQHQRGQQATTIQDG